MSKKFIRKKSARVAAGYVYRFDWDDVRGAWIPSPCRHGHVSPRSLRGQCFACTKVRDGQPDRLLKKKVYKRIRRQDAQYCRLELAGRKDWQLRNPERARQTNQVKVNRRLARKKRALGNYTLEELDTILTLQRGRCAYCRLKFGPSRKPSIDHMIAINCGGTNYATNIQFTCLSCNSRKGARDPVDFARSVGLLI